MSTGTHLCIIPARLLSSRLPGKPLKLLGSDSILKNTWMRANDSKAFDQIVIATDDNTLSSCADNFGAQTVHTAPERLSGTERAAEALPLAVERFGDFRTVTVLPVSLPTISPLILRTLVQKFEESESYASITAVSPIVEVESFLDVHTVKVVTNNASDIMAVSRAPIPYALSGYTEEPTPQRPLSWRLIPVTTYHSKVLSEYIDLPVPDDEIREEIDLLRPLHAGMRCGALPVELKQAKEIIEISTSETLGRAAEFLKQQKG